VVAPPGAPSLVVVDVGNTNVKVVAFGPSGEVISSGLFSGPGFPVHLPGGVPVVAVSVSDRNLKAVEAAVGRALPLLPRDPAAPAGAGIDRVCAAAAAHARAKGAAVAAGLGTAATVDAVDAAGAFLGGAIAPGLRAGAAGLAASAPRLPAPDLSPGGVALPGRTTDAALRAGHLVGFAGLVDRLAEEAARAAAGKGDPSLVPVYLHGGDAGAVLPHLRTRVVHAPHLVAEGARLLFLRT
jgi:type III pantothenate kinase